MRQHGSSMRWAAGVMVIPLAIGGTRVLAADAPAASPDRIVSIRNIMAGIHAPHCGGIAELLKGEGPKDDKTWDTLAMHAGLLNESGFLLMENKRCPDAVWAEATAQLRRGSLAVHAAAGKRDLNAAKEGFKEVTAACGACHAKHKNAAKAPPVAATPAEPAPAKPAPPPPAPEPKAATPKAPAEARVASIRHIMSGVNGPFMGALVAALKDAGPSDDKQWEAVGFRSAMLNEVGYLLMENNRCPDQVWKDACTALRENAARVAQAAGMKNLLDARAGLEGVQGACGSCHKVHKKPPA